MKQEHIMVSIRCLVYNHEPFLRQCLDGFVMQKTTFPFEAIVHDDASTDGSADIIREYAAKYPDIIKPILQTENQFSKKKGIVNRVLDAHTRGKYAAICEGDDYWTDPLKLQKQVEFMEAHPEYSICYHKVQIVNSDTNEVKGEFPDWLPDKPATFELCHLEERNIIQTNSVLYRWRFHDECRGDLCYPGILPGDWLMHLLHAAKGKIYYMPEVMGAYRHHDGGIWSVARKDDTVFYQRHGYAHALFFKNARAVTPLRFEKPLRDLLENIARVCLLNWNPELLGKVRELFPEEMDSVLASYVGKENNKRTRFARQYGEWMVKSSFLYRSSRLLLKIYCLFSGRKLKD